MRQRLRTKGAIARRGYTTHKIKQKQCSKYKRSMLDHLKRAPNQPAVSQDTPEEAYDRAMKGI